MPAGREVAGSAEGRRPKASEEGTRGGRTLPSGVYGDLMGANGGRRRWGRGSMAALDRLVGGEIASEVVRSAISGAQARRCRCDRVGNDNGVRWHGQSLQIPPPPRRRHLVRATVRGHDHPDGTLCPLQGAAATGKLPAGSTGEQRRPSRVTTATPPALWTCWTTLRVAHNPTGLHNSGRLMRYLLRTKQRARYCRMRPIRYDRATNSTDTASRRVETALISGEKPVRTMP